ncbi:MAG: hypothetical protein NTZ09_01945 [Candidatus Hydrogenedentes bacterium]|nr:hypothetical protein [Candidatus Hydrogenedentota bacterium]
MEKMFAAISDLYAKYWNDLLHFALFDREDETWEEAFRKTHRLYMDALDIENPGRSCRMPESSNGPTWSFAGMS